MRFGAAVDLLGPNELQYQALQVSLLWAGDYESADRHYAAEPLLKAFFVEGGGESVPGADERRGRPEVTPLYVVQSAIAYSALDEGERPFGDVGIRAMFDDAANLGTALRYNMMPGWMDESFNDA